MKNVMKATTLESRFPLLAVEHGCIISKDADITAAFEVELPEVYTVTAEEYEGIHATWCKAIKVLPDYSVLHKQDWYVKEEYHPDWQKTGTGFLARSNGMHFNERPYLNHKCYLFLTKTTRERMRRQSNWSTLCRGHIVPKEIRDRETAVKFMEAVETDYRYERLSTDRSDCRLSFAAPLGLLLPCNHIYNQYVFVGNSDEELRRFEKSARNMQSLSRYSRQNAINCEWIEEYLNEAHSQGLKSVRAHCNVMAWSDDGEELKRIRNDVGSQLASMGCVPRHNTTDCPTLFWAGIPGNAADFPAEESFHTFIEQAVCLFTGETNYRDSPSAFGIRMADRISGKPLHIDISDLPMKRGIITNRNKFVLGPSGSGKSFFMNHLVRQYYEQGTHVVLVDTGNSYQGLCEMIHRRTHGQDGIYFTYTEEKPISFNPFYTDDGVFDVEKKDSIKTLLLTLWKSENEPATKTESAELGSAVNAYILKIQQDSNIVPSFNTFYEYLRDVYRKEMEERYIKVEKSDFNIDNLLTTLRQYYRGGRYDFLLNSAENIDLLHKRFVVFEIDAVKDNAELFPVVTIIIMEAFINKMRRLKGVRKQLICEEAWKALSSANMASYLQYLYKTVRKYFGEAIVVTQEVDDIISSPIVKESIINNSDCKILLDQRKYMNRFDQIQSLLGLTEKEKSQILSINQSNDPSRRYKEVWIGLGGTHSAVYATEVSMHEYLAYTTEETEKMEVRELAEKLGGDMEAAIRQVAERRKEERTGQ